MKTKITKQDNESPIQIMLEAVKANSSIDLDKLEKFMIIQQEWEKRQSEKAYNKAISEFKANPPEIIKGTKVSFDTQKGKVNYKYANLANVIEKVTPELSKYGLAISWRTNHNGKITVTCRISHELGHYEETSLCAESDTTGSKNPIQAMGSAVTYLQRYTALALLGLACSDSDNDGRSSGAPISESKKEEPVQPAKPVSLLDRVVGTAQTKFKSVDEFKTWRIDHNLVEDLKKATDTELNYVLTVMREYKPNK